MPNATSKLPSTIVSFGTSVFHEGAWIKGKEHEASPVSLLYYGEWNVDGTIPQRWFV